MQQKITRTEGHLCWDKCLVIFSIEISNKNDKWDTEFHVNYEILRLFQLLLKKCFYWTKNSLNFIFFGKGLTLFLPFSQE